jgi:ABC-type transport system involved in multi-copper enzyme maturation permease subunit
MRASGSHSKNLRGAGTIAFLTVDTLFWSKKTLFVAFILVLVLVLAIFGRLVLSYHWIRAPFTPAQVFGVLLSTAVIHFLVAFVTLFYGTALISEELEGKTLTYLFVRPISKPVVMLGKFIALIWISSVLVLPSVIFCYLILYLGERPLFKDAAILGKDLGVVFLAMLAYGSLFSLLGAWLKHSVLVGLLYAFGWEGIISYLPGVTRKLTLGHYIQSVLPQEDATTFLSTIFGQLSNPIESVVTLLLLSMLFLATACLIVREKEYVLDQ